MPKPSHQASIRFYSGLNYFLPDKQKQTEFTLNFTGNVSIKDLIESTGVPHTEIALILVNHTAVDFSYHVQNKDHISVYPEFSQLDISKLTGIEIKPSGDLKFVLDTHMGKLARYLRMLGFDTLYSNNYSDSELAGISARDRRILLTRDRDLLKRSIVTYGYYVRQTGSKNQLQEIIYRYQLTGLIKPFSRCIKCNGLLVEVNKKQIEDQLQTRTKDYYQHFKQCQDCQKIYWQGSHYQKMQTLISTLVNQVSLPSVDPASL